MNVKDIESIERKIIKFDNLYKNNVHIRRMDNHRRELLEKNEKYRNKYKGERCFILGNGPSINTLDFRSLENEITFTVNEMFRHEKFEQLNSNFHFIADPEYFKLQRSNKEDNEIIDLINNIGKKGKSPVFFLPMESEKIIKKYGWNRRLKIQYFASNLIFYNDYDEQIDFTKYIPAFQAVVQWCIAFAVYAGFKEIYLLGCDATNIITDLTLFADKQADLSYAYNLSEEAADAVKRKHLKNGLEYTLYGYHRIVHLFGELSKYCKKNEVLLCNASGTTILDCMPRKRVCDILGEKAR